MTSKEVAVAFFRHIISEVVEQREGTFMIYMNVSDRWPNSNVQELMPSLQGLSLAEVAQGPVHKIYRFKDYPVGAGEINMAVEDEVRTISITNSAKSFETNVWEVSECIDEYFKPEPEAELSPRCGLSRDELDTIVGRAELANRSLDRRCTNFARSILAEALELANRLPDDFGLHVLLTG